MNKNEKFVITINRELGSGGRTVGRLLAEKLGVPFYDKALIKALEEKYNLTSEEIERMKGRSNNWWSDFERIVSLGHGMILDTPSKNIDVVTTNVLFKAEKEILVVSIRLCHFQNHSLPVALSQSRAFPK